MNLNKLADAEPDCLRSESHYTRTNQMEGITDNTCNLNDDYHHHILSHQYWIHCLAASLVFRRS